MAGPDDPPDDPEQRAPAGDEPRAGDVARAKSTADLEEKLDPATIAQLASWFDLPSFAELEERNAAAAAELPVDEADVARQERLARIAEVANKSILGHLERLTTAGDAMRTRLSPIEIRIGGEIRATDPTWSDHVARIADPREVNVPLWIEDIYKESAPQAILRDLHRPELDFHLRFEYPETPQTLDALSKDLQTEIRAPRKVRPDIKPSWQAVRDAFAELRYWKAAPWGELPLPPKPDPDAEAES